DRWSHHRARRNAGCDIGTHLVGDRRGGSTVTAAPTARPPDLPPTAVVPLLIVITLALHLAGPGPVVPAALSSPGEWSDWLGRTAPMEAAVACLRLMAVVCCYHLLAMQFITLLARAVHRPDLAHMADRLTPPQLRTSARRLAGIGL